MERVERSTSVKDIYWLAGLLEGEGCFTTNSSAAHYRPVIKLKMDDADVVEKALHILKPHAYRKNGNEIKKYSREQESRSFGRGSYYHATIGGRRAAGWMMTLYTLMGERRQARIRQLLSDWHVGAKSEGKAWNQ